MIVKNETKVLPRLFNSIKNYVDYYVIHDTGSEDGTQDLIFKLGEKYNIKGKIFSNNWKNFGYNRNCALIDAVNLKKEHDCSWLLFIDADEELDWFDNSWKDKLENKTTYLIEKHHGNLRYAVPHILNIEEDEWEWRGPAHNYIAHINGPNKQKIIKDPWIIYHSGQGAKSQNHQRPEDKYLRDAILFEKELEKNPNDSRSRMYLAQSYRDAGILDKAYENYLIRAEMEKTWEEERYISYLNCAHILKRQKKENAQIIDMYTRAYDLRPSRPEAPYYLCIFLREIKRFNLSYVFAKIVEEMKFSDDVLFLERNIHEWKAKDARAITAWCLNKNEEALLLFKNIIENNKIPKSDEQRILKNIKKISGE